MRNVSDSNLPTTKNNSMVMDATMESTANNPGVLSNRSSLVKFIRDEDRRRAKNATKESDTLIVTNPYRSVDQLHHE